MTTLTYRAPEKLKPFADKAAAAWNDVLSGLVKLRPWTPPHPMFTTTELNALNIFIDFGKIDRVKHPTRIGECRHLGPDLWNIVLADDIKWAFSWWSRLIGKGENVLACLLHEFGHVFDLPHASNPNYVMYPDMTGSVKMTSNEKASYRAFFLLNLESEE